MSFDILKQQMGRSFVFVVDVYLDQNDVNLDFSGDPGSYNTPRTTQDSAAFNPDQDLKLYRFSNVDLGPGAGPHFPILKSISTTPPVLNDSIGLRASASITLGDTITNDVYELPEAYKNKRVTGSFMFKWLARNYFHNRPVYIHYGFEPNNFNLANFYTESYIINTVSGPDINGETVLGAVDPLIWASRQKAKVPQTTNATLNTVIDDLSVSFTVTDVSSADLFTNGGYIRIDKEIIQYNVQSVALPDVILDILTRATWGTEQADHAIGDSVQDCFFRVDTNVTDIINSILNLAGIEDDLIDLTQFSEAKNGPLATHIYTGIVSKPTAAQDIIKNLLTTNNAKLYWNVTTNKVNIKAVDEFDQPSYTLDALTDIYPDTLKLKFSETEQITRQTINWDKRDATETDDDNFAKRFTFIDDIAESAAVYAKENELAEISTNWVTGTAAGNSIAVGAAQLLVEKRANMPIEISGQVGIEHIGNPGFLLADFIRVANMPIYTGPDLTLNSLNCQVTKLTASDRGVYSFTALALKQPEQGETADYVITQDQENITLTDLAPPISGRETTVIINPGVTIGSLDRTIAALKTGSYPDGLFLRNRGLILGMGGNGASIYANSIEEPAQDGGPALELNADTRIDNGAGGLIWGGGAGGQASGILGAQLGGTFVLLSGSGGGGAQGYGISQGGEGDPIGAQPPGQDWPGGDADPGNNDAPGDGGQNPRGPGINDGERGGFYGEDTTAASGGYSIVTNSFVFSITDGNNSFQIKGGIL